MKMNKQYGIIGAVVAGVLVICCVAGVVGACFPQSEEAAPPRSCRAADTDTAPACELYGEGPVTEVIDGATLKVIVDKRAVEVNVLGIAAPATGEELFDTVECFGRESRDYADGLLMGADVKLYRDVELDEGSVYSGLSVYVLLPDGTNYSVRAAADGMVRAFIDETGANRDTPASLYEEIAEAESAAKTAAKGLWGPPCEGDIAPTPGASASSEPTATPSPTAPEPSEAETSAADEPVEEESGEPTTPPDDDDGDVYYENCAAAEAAGAAPVHKGDPGYGRHLDRDGDGIGCES